MHGRFCLALLLTALIAGATRAHYHMLLPDKHSVKKGETVTFTFQFGHPFEHQLFNAAKPKRVAVLGPDGKTTELLSRLETVELAGEGGKKVKGFRFSFKPDQRGDFVFVALAVPVWMEEEKEYFADLVKVVLHVQAQKGWEQQVVPADEMVPLTRPYGLLPGMVFQARFPPEKGALVEVEHYNTSPPKELPPDELITRTVRTDPNGVATTTLTEPGWWCLTATRKAGMKEHDGKDYIVRQRSTFWVHVDEKPTP